MKRPLLVLYGFGAYALFNASFLYMLGFLQSIGVPKAINDGSVGPAAQALAVNVFLIFLFGFFHSLMARESFKGWWTRFISPDAERPTYVLQSALFLLLAMGLWQPMPTVLWQFEGMAAAIMVAVFALGVCTLLTSTFLIDHFELFGVKQVLVANRECAAAPARFVEPFLYRFVRHPMQLGMVILLFAVPTMTVGHLVFALSMTLYVLIGLFFEERSLLREFPDEYRDYQRRVPMLLPRIFPGRGRAPSGANTAGDVQ